jgi:D-glycero-alpha-D-manno-heptose 1-phosphate guanylyltransferase
VEAIVLAGGFGTRLKQLVPDLPKPMAPINGTPFLEVLLDSLARSGIQRVVLSVGFMANKISDHFGSLFGGMELEYAVERTPLGTGGATRLAMTKCCQDHVFVFNGDTYLNLEVNAVECEWQSRHRPIIVAREVADTMRYGRLLVHGDRLAGISEKGVPGPGLINAGCYVLNRGQLDLFAVNSAFSLETDYLAKAIGDGRFDLFVTSGQFIDIGVPEDYARAQRELRNLRLN